MAKNSNYEAPKDYVEVNERILEFREKYPEGSLQSEWGIERDVPVYGKDGKPMGHQTYVWVRASAYRNADDPIPGVGLAWEPMPGRTPYTRESELMNAETSAWGRALIAVGAADAKRGIATANEVRNRQYLSQDDAWPTPAQGEKPPARNRTGGAQRASRGREEPLATETTQWHTNAPQNGPEGLGGKLDMDELKKWISSLQDGEESLKELRAKRSEITQLVASKAMDANQGSGALKLVTDAGKAMAARVKKAAEEKSGDS
jgi:hypothetical protein